MCLTNSFVVYSVGILKFVKERCTNQINSYDNCLKANSENPEECVQALKELYFCTEATSIAYRDQQKPSDSAAKPAEKITKVEEPTRKTE